MGDFLLKGPLILGTTPDPINSDDGNAEEEHVELKCTNLYYIFETTMFDSIELEYIFTNNDYSFITDLVMTKSVNRTMSKYIKRYICSFFNAKLRECHLIFGLTDDGDVDGMLLPKSMTSGQITKIVHTEIDKLLTIQTIDEGVLEDLGRILKDNVVVNVTDVDYYHECLYDYTDEVIEKGLKRRDVYRKIYKKVHKRKSDFNKIMYELTRSVNDIINNSKFMSELIVYIIDNAPNDIINYLVPMIESHISGDEPIILYDGQVTAEKKDPLTFSYWLTTFRNKRVIEYSKLKPSREIGMPEPKPFKQVIYSYPLKRIITSYQSMYPDTWEDVIPFKLAVIEIKMPGRLVFPESMHDMRLKYYKDGRPYTPVRMMTDSGPSCEPFSLF